MKCVCGHEEKDFIWLPLLETVTPDFLATEEYIDNKEKQEAEMKRRGMIWPIGELKRLFACPKCGTLKIEVS
ncbi:MAG: hypothetical protein LBH42_03975 [Treponema sp.]|jgi:hypothetical protein|nr:hypothetical protein [Treponema sp.]